MYWDHTVQEKIDDTLDYIQMGLAGLGLVPFVGSAASAVIRQSHMDEWHELPRHATVSFAQDRRVQLAAVHLLRGGVTETNVREWVARYFDDVAAFVICSSSDLGGGRREG